jgi:hypothetical protein
MIVMFRTRGGCRVLTLGFGVVAATALALAVAAMLIVGTVVGATVILARAVLPSSWRRRNVEAATHWPSATIDTTIVAEEEQARVRDAPQTSPPATTRRYDTY